MTKRLTIALIALVALVLVAVLPVSATYYDINNSIINVGATVYAGEQQLNLSVAQNAYAEAYGVYPEKIGWWASSANPTSSTPSAVAILTGSNTSYYVAPSTYAGTFGSNGQSLWYVIDPATGFADVGTPAFLIAANPQVGIDIWDLTSGTTVTSGTAIQGDYLAFKINTNLQSAINNPTARANDAVGTPQLGNIDIKVKSATGNTYLALYSNVSDKTTKSITAQNVTSGVWFWGTSDGNQPSKAPSNYAPNWSTGSIDASGQNAYPAGVYTVLAQSRLNGMYDNYLNGGATYTGATVSSPATVTITSNTVSISANVDSVVRSKPFSVTITGAPYGVYHLWVKGTSSLDGSYDNQPPYITPNQVGVIQDSVFYPAMQPPADPQDSTHYANAAVDNGNYSYQNSGGQDILTNVAPSDKFGPFSWAVANGGTGNVPVGDIALGNGTYVYANVTLDQTGTRTVQFTTTNWTKAQQYTVRVEQNFGGATGFKYDEVQLQVQKGAVTIVAAGSDNYYLGEEVQFSGTNTESQYTYLFITGPNLPKQGTDMNVGDPRNYQDPAAPTGQLGVFDGSTNGFVQVSVNGDNTWSWEWGTQAVALDAGTYTVYAVSEPEDANTLQDVAYGTVSINIKTPFVSATASQSTVAQGDPVYITGTAEGQPALGVNIWILGKNYTSSLSSTRWRMAYSMSTPPTLVVRQRLLSMVPPTRCLSIRQDPAVRLAQLQLWTSSLRDPRVYRAPMQQRHWYRPSTARMSMIPTPSSSCSLRHRLSPSTRSATSLLVASLPSLPRPTSPLVTTFSSPCTHHHSSRPISPRLLGSAAHQARFRLLRVPTV